MKKAFLIFWMIFLSVRCAPAVDAVTATIAAPGCGIIPQLFRVMKNHPRFSAAVITSSALLAGYFWREKLLSAFRGGVQVVKGLFKEPQLHFKKKVKKKVEVDYATVDLKPFQSLLDKTETGKGQLRFAEQQTSSPQEKNNQHREFFVGKQVSKEEDGKVSIAIEGGLFNDYAFEACGILAKLVDLYIPENHEKLVQGLINDDSEVLLDCFLLADYLQVQDVAIKRCILDALAKRLCIKEGFVEKTNLKNILKCLTKRVDEALAVFDGVMHDGAVTPVEGEFFKYRPKYDSVERIFISPDDFFVALISRGWVGHKNEACDIVNLLNGAIQTIAIEDGDSIIKVVFGSDSKSVRVITEKAEITMDLVKNSLSKIEKKYLRPNWPKSVWATGIIDCSVRSPDGKIVVSGREPGFEITIKNLTANTTKVIPGQLSHAVFSRDSKFVFMNDCVLMNLNDYTRTMIPDGRKVSKYSADKEYFACTGGGPDSKEMTLVHFVDGSVKTIKTSEAISKIAFSNNNKFILTVAAVDETIRLLRLRHENYAQYLQSRIAQEQKMLPS